MVNIENVDLETKNILMQNDTTISLNGAENLIEGCIGDVTDKTILLVCEDPTLGWYDNDSPIIVETELLARGAKVQKLNVGLPENIPNANVQEAMHLADQVIFFSRIGDQGRFNAQYQGSNSVMCYSRNAKMLNSGFGTLAHIAMCALKNAIDEVILNAEHISVTCPEGTHFEGSPNTNQESKTEVFISRFPMGVHTPVLADRFRGRVCVSRYLTPTGSKVYKPECLKLETPVTAHFKGNLIEKFSGSPSVVTKVEEHYQNIAQEFNLDKYNIHSWHAGIHPLMEYDRHISNCPTRWSETVFSSTRFLHFHTCGKEPPGEICWMILDPTIVINGVALWENGFLCPNRFPQTNAILKNWPSLKSAFNLPSREVGLLQGE